ncbi:MAG: hypothetical protein KatS3mg094_434 [Candidatus Parcubacteria bacterium]|nr:MAG: hypothetical protein KatS3mg094_434 [Candidatus Parcubacteria bacterium]
MFKVLAHTADIKFKIEANNFEGIIKDSLRAINYYLSPKYKDRTKNLEKNFSKKIENKFNEFLIDFLNEILALTYIKKRIFRIRKINLNNKILKLTLVGYSYNSLEREIKSITYHQSKIYKKNNKYFFEFIVDV